MSKMSRYFFSLQEASEFKMEQQYDNPDREEYPSTGANENASVTVRGHGCRGFVSGASGSGQHPHDSGTTPAGSAFPAQESEIPF